MITPELQAILQKLPKFRGVFARDQIPKDGTSVPHSLVMNYDAHDQQGSHWVCIYVDENGFGDYFDSYGLPPLAEEFVDYLNSNTNQWNWNKITLQCEDCVTCGEYCCAYLILRNSGYNNQDFINLFTHSGYTNDYIIKNIFDILT